MVVINNTLAKLEGESSRVNEAQQDEAFANTGAADIPFGYVVVKDSSENGGGKLPAAGDDTQVGIAIREVKQGDVNGAANVGIGEQGTVKRVGYVWVKVVYGYASVVDGGKVYYRYALGGTGSATRAIGTIEQAAVTSEVIELVGAKFNGICDSDQLVEVRLGIF